MKQREFLSNGNVPHTMARKFAAISSENVTICQLIQEKGE